MIGKCVGQVRETDTTGYGDDVKVTPFYELVNSGRKLSRNPDYNAIVPSPKVRMNCSKTVLFQFQQSCCFSGHGHYHVHIGIHWQPKGCHHCSQGKCFNVIAH